MIPCGLKDCSPCLNDGMCTDLVNNYTCKCQPGYRGRNCEIDIDYCEENSCQNGGNCSELEAGYQCHCAAGFTGKNCSVNIDECIGNLCQNGGRCIDGIDSYECDCSAIDFHGVFCETSEFYYNSF